MEYIHNKTGNVYEVIAEAIDATNSRDGQIVIIYRNAKGEYFVRDKKEFLQKFTIKN
jgi:hypothetical protein